MTRPIPTYLSQSRPVYWACGLVGHWHGSEAKAQACLDADEPCPKCDRRRSACLTMSEAFEADGHAVSSCLECLLTDRPTPAA